MAGDDAGEWPSSDLPKTWRWTDFATFFSDYTDSQRKVPVKSYNPEGYLAVVDQGSARFGGFTNDLSMRSPAPLPAIVFGDHTRAVKYIDIPFAQGADGVRVLTAKEYVEPAFAYQALRCIKLPDKGYSRHFKFLKASSFPLAPLPEQRRIVAKIDSLSGKSKRARNHLAHIPRLVEKYKQAVLAAAFRGDLTREWRTQNGIADFLQAPLHTLCASITDGDHQAPPKASSGVPFITISAMNDGKIDLRKATRFVPEAYLASLKPTRVASRGDVLFSVTGSFGIPALVETDDPFIFQRHIAIIKPDSLKTNGKYLSFILASPQLFEQASTVATGTAQLTVPLSGLRSFIIPAPSMREQAKIIHRIESAFTWIDRLAADTTRATKLVDHLDQSVLAKAFRGELVPQDPADEPASVLLERIRAERATATKPKRGRRKAT